MGSKENNKRPIAAWLLIALLLFIGLGALISGAMLFIAPDGHLMQWSTADLVGTPFSNYLIPGMILFTFIGLFPVFVGYSLLKRPSWTWPNVLNPSKDKHWAWTAAWAAGVIMLIWIAVETLLLGYISFLQPVTGVYGAVIILLTLLPKVRKYYSC
jgi:hypothetical protein